MKRKDLIDLYHSVEDTYLERKRLGEFDANSKHMLALLENMLALTQHAIETAPDFVEAKKKKAVKK